LIDETGYPWVLEVNMSPGVTKRDAAHNNMVKRMSTSLLQLVLATHQSEGSNNAKTSSSPLASNSTGDWEALVTCEWEVKRDFTSDLTNSDYYLDNRVAVVGKAMAVSEIQFFDACFTRCDKQRLLQRYVPTVAVPTITHMHVLYA
jgi:hypothetical protein